jgi:hypothetical protein
MADWWEMGKGIYAEIQPPIMQQVEFFLIFNLCTYLSGAYRNEYASEYCV